MTYYQFGGMISKSKQNLWLERLFLHVKNPNEGRVGCENMQNYETSIAC